jgi:Spy/CpxP family protein refolding chaperone
MDRFNRSFRALVAAFSVMASLGLAAPSPPEAATHPRPGGGFDAAQSRWLAQLEELDLTPDQRQAVRSIAERFHARGVELAQRASRLREEFVETLPDDRTYASATERASDGAALLAADAVRMLSDMRSELHAVLSDEQRQRLRERLSAERSRWEDWRARHKPQ